MLLAICCCSGSLLLRNKEAPHHTFGGSLLDWTVIATEALFSAVIPRHLWFLSYLLRQKGGNAWNTQVQYIHCADSPLYNGLADHLKRSQMIMHIVPNVSQLMYISFSTETVWKQHIFDHARWGGTMCTHSLGWHTIHCRLSESQQWSKGKWCTHSSSTTC